MKEKSILEIHLAVLLFGLAGLFGKWVVLPSAMIVLGRVFFASLSLAIILLAGKLSLRIRPKSDYFLLFGLGGVLTVHWITFFQSIQVSTVAVGLLSYSSFPVFAVFLEPLFFRERLHRLNIFLSFMCLAGVFLIIPRFRLEDSVYRGVLWGLCSGFTFALLAILNRRLRQRHSSLVISFFQDSFSFLFLLPLFFILKPGLDARNLVLLVFLGVFCTALSHTLFIEGMKHVKAQNASIISTLEPVYGIFLAAILLGEVPSLRTILGGTLILGTALTVSWRTGKKSAS